MFSATQSAMPKPSHWLAAPAIARQFLLFASVTTVIAPAAVDAQQTRTQEKSRVFRAGTGELSAFTGYSMLSEDINLGSDDGPPNYTDNVPDSSPLTGMRLGYNITEMFAAEFEIKQARTVFRRGKGGDTVHGVTIVAPRLNALAHLNFDRRTIRPFLLLGVGAEKLWDKKEDPNDPLNNAEADEDVAIHAGAGVKYHITDRLSFRLDARAMVSETQAGSMGLTGYEFLFGGAINLFLVDQDPDHDGIATSRDACPAQAEDMDGFEDNDGCPESDNDRDGIADKLDKCPLEKETFNKVDDEDGCPDQDADGDLIEDRRDKCPNKAEDFDKFMDEDGCPEPDNDKDGKLDKQDKCPDDAEDKDGYQDDDGCPDPDNDGDGIFDKVDKCPNKLETHNGFDDDDGCPDTVPKKVAKEFRGTIDGIFFAKDSADIDNKSSSVLEKALDVLKDFPGVKIEIGGHTDNTGYLEYNQQLSVRRAEAVRQWFIERGIAGDRMKAVGYGRTKPIAANTTEAGRSKNRRIEFILLVRKR